MLSGAGKIGIGLDAVADINHHQKGWPFGQCLGVLFSLTARPKHRSIPGFCSADAVPPPPWSCETGLFEKRRFLLCLATLLGFEDEAALPVKVDETWAGGAVRVVKMHRPLEHVTVAFWLARRRFRARKPEKVTQLD